MLGVGGTGWLLDAGVGGTLASGDAEAVTDGTPGVLLDAGCPPGAAEEAPFPDGEEGDGGVDIQISRNSRMTNGPKVAEFASNSTVMHIRWLEPDRPVTVSDQRGSSGWIGTHLTGAPQQPGRTTPAPASSSEHPTHTAHGLAA